MSVELARFRKSPKIVKILTLQQFSEGYVPIMALYILLFDKSGGLSFEQIGILFSVWSLSFLIAELPTGVLADYWSRRNVIIMGALLKIIGFSIWLVWPSFWGYLIGFMLWGFMIACSSGSTAALLRSELESMGERKQFTRYYGYMSAGLATGYLLGYLTAAILTLRYANALIILTIISAFITLPLLLTIKESSYQRKSSYLQTMMSGFKEIRRSPKLQIISFILFSIFMIYGVLEELIPRVYDTFGVSERGISLFVALTYFFSAFILTKLEKYAKAPLWLQTLAIGGGLSFLLLSFSQAGFVGAVFLLSFGLIMELLRSLFLHHIQDAVEGDEKATISSIPGLAGGLLGALAYVVIGQIAKARSEVFAIASYSVFWIFTTLILAFFAYKYSRRPKA